MRIGGSTPLPKEIACVGTMTPKVSVLMSVKNGERWLREALNSILLLQTFTDFECLVVDDGSTDGTARVLKEYANHPAIRYLIREGRGLAVSLNELARASSGEYLARQDADDISRADRFAKQVAFLDAHPDIGLLGTWALQIDAAGRPLGEERWNTGDQELREYLPRVNPFVHTSVMMRRSVFEQVGGYDESFRVAQDYDLWLKMSRVTQMAILPEPLVLRRMHLDQVSAKPWPRRWAQAKARSRHALHLT